MQVEDQAESLCCAFGLCSHSTCLSTQEYIWVPGFCQESLAILEGERGNNIIFTEIL